MASITFRCPSCQQMLKAAEEKAGRKLKCGKCGAVVTVPDDRAEQIRPAVSAPPVVRPAPAPPVVEAEVDYEAGPPTGRRPREAGDDYDEPRPRARRPARDDEEYWDERPRGRRDCRENEDDFERPRRPAARTKPSGMATLVGVLNLLYAAGIFAIAAGIIIGGPTLLGMATGMGEKMLDHDIGPNDPKMKKELEAGKKLAKEGLQTAFAMGAFLFIMMGGCLGIIGGVPLLLAGIGVLKRRQWGRVLTLILGPLYLLGAVAFVYEYYPLNRYGWMWVGANIAYGVIVFVILLIPKFAEEFE